MTIKDGNEYFSTSEAAHILGVTSETVRRWMKDKHQSNGSWRLLTRRQIADMAREYGIDPYWPDDATTYMSIGAAAAFLGVCKSRMRLLPIKPFKTGNRATYRKIQLVEYMEKNNPDVL